MANKNTQNVYKSITVLYMSYPCLCLVSQSCDLVFFIVIAKGFYSFLDLQGPKLKFMMSKQSRESGPSENLGPEIAKAYSEFAQA